MSNVKTDAMLAREASYRMSVLPSAEKNAALACISKALWEKRDIIFEENKKDIKEAEKNQVAAPILKRLFFDEKKLQDVIDGIKSLVQLEDPVGKKLLGTELDTDLNLYRVSCPLGVIGIVFESRPDALVQIASLCLKAGNAVILKGGSEAFHTNRILFDVISKAGEESDLPPHWINLWETREQVKEMLTLTEYIDLIIPRGSNEFVQEIMSHTKIPVLGHADGVCHLYIHEKAEVEMARKLSVDSKTQYVSVCNAAETILVDEAVASVILPVLEAALKEKNVILHGCEKTAAVIDVLPVKDWHYEYLDYEVSIRVVSGIDDAIAHINRYGSGHTDAIVTSDEAAANIFLSRVDSGNVFWNCSTRFSDGFRYGFGAEVGVSTSKIHARGPVGLEGLLTYKYFLYGNGQIVENYAKGVSHFTHEPIL